MGQDRGIGNFTYRNISVLDYIIATTECFRYLTYFTINDTVLLQSDGHSFVKQRPTWKNNLSQNVKDTIDGEHVRFIHEQLNIQP